MAAAIGAGLPVSEPTGNMIVDIGGGTTEVAVISLGGIVVSQSIRVGGDEMDEAIMSSHQEGVQAPDRPADRRGAQARDRLGVGAPARRSRPRCAGATCSPGCRRRSCITSEEMRRALDEPVGQIIDAIKSTLDKTPPELAADIMDRGIVLAGGGALLNGLDERLRDETQMPVQLAESPLTCVAVGSGRSLEEFEVIHRSAKARHAATAAAASTSRRYRFTRAGRFTTLVCSVPRQRTARLPVLDAPVRRGRRPSLATGTRLQSAARRGCARARLARPDHRLLPRGERRRPARRPAHRRLRPHAVRGRRRARRAAVPGRLGVDVRPPRRQGRERGAAPGERGAPPRGDRGADRRAQENASSRARSPTYIAGPEFPTDFEPVVARIIGRPPTPYQQEVIVSAGSDDGIRGTRRSSRRRATSSARSPT